MRPLRGRMVTAAEKQGNYEETQVVLQETVQIFSQKTTCKQSVIRVAPSLLHRHGAAPQGDA